MVPVETSESTTGAAAIDWAVDPIGRARRRNERSIAAVVLGAAAIGIGTVLWRMATIESQQGRIILVVACLFALGSLGGLFYRGPTWRWVPWVRSTLEVSVVFLVLLLDLRSGPDFLITSSTSYLFAVGIMASTLRLDPRLTLYATVLAAVEHVIVYLLVFKDPSRLHLSGPAISLPRMEQEAVFRTAVLVLVGLLGMMLTRTLRKEVARAADESRVRTAFGYYVDARLVRRILAGDLRVAPERRRITVMFVDIRNFTAMAETGDPARLFAQLSATLDAFAGEVQRQGGLVNKFMGDGLFAIFGAPEEQSDQARRAVRAALEIAAAAKRRSEDGRFPGLAIGIGLHTGEAAVGDLGGERREFTAIGDVVNVASRVEQMNKELGTTILATRSLCDAVGAGLVARPHPQVTLRGREAQIELLEVIDLERGEQSSTGLRMVARAK